MGTRLQLRGAAVVLAKKNRIDLAPPEWKQNLNANKKISTNKTELPSTRTESWYLGCTGLPARLIEL
jgi:hypothetical protein